MPESAIELENRLQDLTRPDFRGQLLDRGLARGLIWREGELPDGSPNFAATLTDDLLDYAYGVLAVALRLRDLNSGSPTLTRALLVAGEAIEAAVHRGEEGRPDRGLHRVSAAVAFHIAGYAARAYSMLPGEVFRNNLAPTEQAVVLLLRRALDGLYKNVGAWLSAPENQDASVALRLRDDAEFSDSDAVHVVLTNAFMRGMALFGHAIATGVIDSASLARARLRKAASAAQELHAVNHWWTATLASHLVDGLWEVAMHQQIPRLPPDAADASRWEELRRDYIQRLASSQRAAVELWPSQLSAAHRSTDEQDDLVVALPTSAGKTRVAELCILRALSGGRRVVYVTPLRALSAQVERDLASTFAPLGFRVSALYGAAGVESGDADTLREGQVVVSTPEKLDFALRNDATLIDDVGLVVLDEGHMLGPSEREVRYEALVQRLLLRPDAATRRVVCLSALFPTPEEMTDLVAWVRQDNEGEPVHSTWRPTRHRYGTITWTGHAGRLEFDVEGENPFVPRFVGQNEPPTTTTRRRPFPAEKNELTLATAWRFVDQGKDVLIFCSMRKSVEALGKLVRKCIKQGVLAPLREPSIRVKEAMASGEEWLGADHPAVQCLQYGVALHHAGLPRAFLGYVETLLRAGDCPVTIASPTLAQGLNLAASVLLVPNIRRGMDIIPTKEFANVVGRAGRAFVDVEGLIVHVVWELNPRKRARILRDWRRLVDEAQAPAVMSGLLELAIEMCKRLAKRAHVPVEEIVEHVTAHAESWVFSGEETDELVGEEVWERDLASLDAAILALLDTTVDEEGLETELLSVLEGSLFSRQLQERPEKRQSVVRGIVAARAQRIWASSTERQRRGYRVAGVGLSAGKFLDSHSEELLMLLGQAEVAIRESNSGSAVDPILQFAEKVLPVTPFRPDRSLPETWKAALRAWLDGVPGSEVVEIGGIDGVFMMQDAFCYRLPWAMEAVRVHGKSLDPEEDGSAGLLEGLSALATEVGSLNATVIRLLRSGLNSREAAAKAVEDTGATFDDGPGLVGWRNSDVVKELSEQEGWPTERSRAAWLHFFEFESEGGHRSWERSVQRVPVRWDDDAEPDGVHVVLDEHTERVLTPDLVPRGRLLEELERPATRIVRARVVEGSTAVSVEYFGPLR